EENLAAFLEGKTVLLTGGTGSFGRAFIRHVLARTDCTIRIFSRDELKQSQIRDELGDADLRFLIGDVRDRDRLFRAAQGADVIGSRGSVVPIFYRQREQGMLTITDERMTRFWISLDQSVELVLFALAHAHGGEIFIPKIPSIHLLDLAEAMAPGMPRKVVGIR